MIWLCIAVGALSISNFLELFSSRWDRRLVKAQRGEIAAKDELINVLERQNEYQEGLLEDWRRWGRQHLGRE